MAKGRVAREVNSFDPLKWPEDLRLERILLNGSRVTLTYQSRGLSRARMANRCGISAAELRTREHGWHYWEDAAFYLLAGTTDYPLRFFVQADPPELFAPGVAVFWSGHDEEGNPTCWVEYPNGRPKGHPREGEQGVNNHDR